MAPSSSSSSPYIADNKCAENNLSEISEEESTIIKKLQRGQWLRAAILGANDGLLSTTSLMIGVGAAKEDQRDMILAGLAGAVAGACSMAVGEFVSVSTQRDIEKSIHGNCGVEEDGDNKIKIEIISNTDLTTARSPAIMEADQRPAAISTSLTPARSPMMRVVEADAKQSKLRRLKAENGGDRNKNNDETLPSPYKAAAASGLAFLCGSLPPLLTSMVVAPNNIRIIMIVVLASVALAVFGAAGAYFGGSPVRKSAGRVLIGGWISMALTYGMLKSFDKDSKGHDDDD